MSVTLIREIKETLNDWNNIKKEYDFHKRPMDMMTLDNYIKRFNKIRNKTEKNSYLHDILTKTIDELTIAKLSTPRTPKG